MEGSSVSKKDEIANKVYTEMSDFEETAHYFGDKKILENILLNGLLIFLTEFMTINIFCLLVKKIKLTISLFPSYNININFLIHCSFFALQIYISIYTYCYQNLYKKRIKSCRFILIN